MTLILQSLHKVEHSIDDYILRMLRKNTILSYMFLFIVIPLGILAVLAIIGILALPLAYLFV